MGELRKVHRGRTYYEGRIVFNDRRSVLDCLVRNMSRNGAKVEFAHSALVPDEFVDLVIPRKDASRRARIVWRRELDIGVIFLDAEIINFVPLETARKIRKLEEQRDALRRRVAELSEPAI